jgi:hypothetical protein
MSFYFGRDTRGEIRGLFERRGREGFAENAKREYKNKTKNTKEFNAKQPKLFFKFWLFIFSDFFCALCETFAPSAFKKSPSSKSLNND